MSACTSEGSQTTQTPSRPSTASTVLGDSTVAPLVKALPQKSIAPATTTKLAKGLIPPTNKWYSGLAFGAESFAVFPFPISFQETATGFSAGLPPVTATENTLFGENVPQVTLDVGASTAVVSRYDDVSVTVEHRKGSTVIGHTTIAEGSPLVSYVAASSQTTTLDGQVASTVAGRGTLTVSGQEWAVVTTGGSIDGASVKLDKGGSVVLFPVPSGASSSQLTKLMTAAEAPLTGVTTAYKSVSKGEQTSLGYTTASGSKAQSTIVVPLPHQGSDAASTGCTGLTYTTIYGTVPVCISSGLTFTTAAVEATGELDLSKLSSSQKATLKSQLEVDVSSLPTFNTDTYYGGKSLYRAAMLLQIARQLGDSASAKTLTTKLTTEISLWMEPDGCTTRGQECFVYDPKLKTIVGLVNSFGSELANDHHFHYGYFLYAAGVVAQNDPALAKRWAPVMNLLAADIATNTGDQSGTYFPDTRAYDPYFSHAWASGYSEFNDGNNQESSSEAVNAWNGLALWAKASGDSGLEAEANWMLSGETASALAYYVNPDLTGSEFDGFSHELVSLNWGGKRDYATWFSAAPSAIIGIQLIPMSPVSTYLGTEAGGGSKHIISLVDTALSAGTNVTLADYVLMYESLAGTSSADAALAAAKKFPSASIDNGNSRTYMLAFIMAQQTK
ncbi:glycosyl hydrolase [Frondihabitans sp. PhB188]|uniref:glycosyl hydrolase n=1 Tax=Frondihabitans sp. PhB188 TaxID=2485200 RepID=UPI0013156F29|nr:glycosyl hydrolase [Frondihabitans sp. PhB188]